jgi:thiol:disulfide interchange protein DsbD
MMRRATSAAWILAATMGLAGEGDPDATVAVTADLVVDADALVPGQPLTAAIRFVLAPGWHTYWRNPGDSGMAPDIRWQLPEGFAAGPIQWPAPVRIDGPEGVTFGYEKEVLLPVVLTPPASLATGTMATLSADVRYLVCRDACRAGRTKVSLTLPVRAHAAPSPDHGLIQTWLARLPVAPTGVMLSASRTPADIMLRVHFRERVDTKALRASFFPAAGDLIDLQAPPKLYPTDDHLTLQFRAFAPDQKSPPRFTGVLQLEYPGRETPRIESLSVEIPLDPAYD